MFPRRSGSSSDSSVNGELPRPQYLPAYVSGYDARQVPLSDDDRERQEPVVEQREPVVERQGPVVEEQEPLVEQQEPVVEQQEPTGEQQLEEQPAVQVLQHDEFSDKDELDESTVELHLLGPLDDDEPEESPEESQPEVPTGDSRPDDAREDDQTGEPAQGEPAGASPPPIPADEEAEDSEEEWIGPEDVASGAEHEEEEPDYEYAAPYVDPFAGFRSIRGYNLRPRGPS